MRATKTTTLKTFNDFSKIIFIQGEILGLITFSRTKSGLTPSKIKYLGNIFRGLAFTSFTCYFLFRLTSSPYIPLFSKCTPIICYGYSIFYINLVLILSASNSRKFIEFILNVAEFDANFSLEKIVQYLTNRRKIQRYWLSKYVFLSVFFVLFNTADNVNFFTISSSCMGSLLCVVTFIICQVTTELVLHLHFRFVFLNRRLLTIVRYFSNQELNSIMKENDTKRMFFIFSEICTWHHHLSKLIRLFNEIFGVPLLFAFGYTFLVSAVSFFYIAGEFQKSEIDWVAPVFLLVVVLLYLLDTTRLCDACYRTVEEVSCFLSGVIILILDYHDGGSNSQNSDPRS